ELKTPTGERFIKLLENNSPENLNENKHQKSVIEVLASYSAGRELLRKNKNIQSLILDATRQLSVNGKTIDEWMKMEREEPEAEESKKKKKKSSNAEVVSSQGLFASTAQAILSQP